MVWQRREREDATAHARLSGKEQRSPDCAGRIELASSTRTEIAHIDCRLPAHDRGRDPWPQHSTALRPRAHGPAITPPRWSVIGYGTCFSS